MGKWLFRRQISRAQCVRAALVAGAAGGMLPPAAAQAADRDVITNFEITPFSGYMAGGEFEDPRRRQRSRSRGGHQLRRHLQRRRRLLASLRSALRAAEHPDRRRRRRLDLDVQYLQIGGIVSYPDAERVIPYFGMTVGAAQLQPGRARTRRRDQARVLGRPAACKRADHGSHRRALRCPRVRHAARHRRRHLLRLRRQPRAPAAIRAKRRHVPAVLRPRWA